MKKYTQIKFDKSDSLYYIKNVLNTLLLNHKDRVYVVYRDPGFSPSYRYYMLCDVLFRDKHMVFFKRHLNINRTSASLITADILINKNVRIFVDMNHEI